MKKLPLLACLVLALSACSRTGAKPRPPVTPPVTPPDSHIIVPLRGPVDDLNHNVDRALKVGIAASGVSIFGLIFVAIEASAFLKIAFAIAAGCAGMTLGLIALRLAIPLVALFIPWFLGATVIAALVCALVWAEHGGVQLKLAKWWKARKNGVQQIIDAVKP